MRFFYAFIIILTSVLICKPAFAQIESPIDTSKRVILLKETSWGITFHTQGWGIKYSRGKNRTAFSRSMLVFEFGEMRSFKQIRTLNQYFTSSKSYVYGKLNSVFMLRGMVGKHKLLNRKPYWGGVEVRLVYLGGVSLGIAKPVYLNILKTISLDYTYSIRAERYDPDEHFVDNIFGRASFTKGFGEIGVYPGIVGKVGLDFEYGVYRTKVKSLEIGAIIEVFPIPVPIMAFNDPNYFFFTFYFNFNFGKRFN